MKPTTFSNLGLAEPILRGLKARNHNTPTPIQAQAIPKVLEGRDMLGIAQTGTGKTGAFILPVLHHLSQAFLKKGDQRVPRALILAPTRELAVQINDEFRAYGKFVHLRQSVIFGGVSQKAQVQALYRGVDVIIATPGRFLDLMNQKHLGLDNIEFFIIDEADRMFDMGFIRDVQKIVHALPKSRQSLLFSATMAQEIVRLSGDVLQNPIHVEVTPQATPVERIHQSVYHVDTHEKKNLLQNLLKDSSFTRVMVFARTKHRANRISEQLGKAGVSAEVIHGNKSQGARQLALKRFRFGEVRVLVATDIAARGIDIDGVTHVINFELPNEAEGYVHRIGRTARAGANGIAVSFCDSSERKYLRDIERLIRQPLTVIGEKPQETKDHPLSSSKTQTKKSRKGKSWAFKKTPHPGSKPSFKHKRRAA